MCSNSGRFRRRRARGRCSPARPVPWSSDVVTQPGSAFVGHRQALPPLCPAPLQNDAAVLGRHPHAKAMSLGAAPLVRLVRPLALHECYRAAVQPLNWVPLFNGIVIRLPTVTASSPWLGQTPMVVSIDSGVNHSILCYSPRSLRTGGKKTHARQTPWVSPQDFHKLWKRLWKSARDPCASICAPLNTTFLLSIFSLLFFVRI